MGDWVKLPESGIFLNLEKYSGPDLEMLGLSEVDKGYLSNQLGIRVAYRASRLRISSAVRSDAPDLRKVSFSTEHKSKARIRQ